MSLLPNSRLVSPATDLPSADPTVPLPTGLIVPLLEPLSPSPSPWVIEVASHKEARDILNEFAARHGHAISVKNSISRGVTLQCDRGGLPDERSNRKTSRKTTSRRCGCQLSARLRKVSRGWEFTVIQGSHNSHIASMSSTHPLHRRRQLHALKERVLQYFALSHTSQEVMHILQKENAYQDPQRSTDPTNISLYLTPRDLTNLRHLSRRLSLGGCSLTEALLKGILGWEILWKEVADGTHRIEHIFCACQSGLDLLAPISVSKLG